MKNTIISANFFQDVIYRLAYYFGLKHFQSIILKWQDTRYERQQNFLIERINPKVIVASESIRMRTKPKQKLVILSFHGDPRYINKIRESAGIIYPEWLKAEPILPSLDLSLDLADQIISLSNFSARGIVTQQKKSVPVKVIPVGPLLLPSKKLTDQIEGNDKLMATFVGRMTLMKGLPTYLKISKEFSERIDFNLCGYASPEIITKIHGEKSEKLQINQSPSKNELERILEKSDIYISPSFYEGFGIAALEAMSFGCIPVCSMNSAITEVIGNTDLAKFIFDPFDYNSLSSVLNLLLDSNIQDLMKYKKMATQISRKYSYENFSAELFEFMDETEKHAN
jgi:glycosyltransferase involved in cell wall biosynthesis